MGNLVFPEPTPEQQAEAVIRTEHSEHERPRKAGDKVVIVSGRWFNSWLAYTGHVYDTTQRRIVLASSDINTSQPSPRPGPLDASDLIDTTTCTGDLTAEELASIGPLKPGLKEKEDFWMLHEATYNLLRSWYKSTGPEIMRQYLPTGPAKRLELYQDQWHFKAVDEHTGRSDIIPALKMSQVAGLKTACCDILRLEEDEVELCSWAGQPNLVEQTPTSLEASHAKTLLGVNLKDRQAVILRRKDRRDIISDGAMAVSAPAIDIPPTAAAALAPIHTAGPTPAIPMSVDTNVISPIDTNTGNYKGIGGFLPSPTLQLGTSLSPRFRGFGTSPTLSSPLSRSFGRAPGWAEDTAMPCSGRRPGLAGLGNLGNTCFMNSSVQCLAHTVPFMRTFLTGEFKADLNRDNPLGLGGKLALAFGGLMGKLWKGDVSHVTPKHFKWALGKFAPQFGGYAQQDSQELLAFLLDGLHEDLNKITVKPYREEKDANGRPDEEVAAEAWENYRARNDSVVVDHFQGMYKSTLKCPDCATESVKFDPFMYLSLPLPTPKTRTLHVVVLDEFGEESPIEVVVQVLKNGKVGDLVEKIKEVLGNGSESVRRASSLSSFYLLAQYSQSGGTTNRLEFFPDPNSPMSVIPEPLPKPRFSYSFSKPPQLVAFQIPSPLNEAPSGRPVVLLHRRRGVTIFGYPNIFIVSPEELEKFRLVQNPTRSGQWYVLPSSQFIARVDTVLAQYTQNEGIEEEQIEPSNTANHNTGEDHKTEAIRGGHTIPAAANGGMPNLQAHPLFGSLQDVDELHNGDDEDGDVTIRTATRPNSDAGDIDGDDRDQMMVDLDDLERPDTPVHSVDGTPSSSDGEAEMTESQRTSMMMNPSTAFGSSLDFSGMNVDETQQEGGATSIPVEETQQQQQQQRYTFTLASPNGVVKFHARAEPPSIESDEEPLYLLVDWTEQELARIGATSAWEEPRKHETAVAAAAAMGSPAKPVSLTDCVEAFLQPEELDASDSWFCSKCKAHVQAEKKLDLWSLPDVLVVHLKRFSYSRYSRDKLDTEVQFPLENLDLRGVVPVSQGGTLVLEDTGKRTDVGSTAAAPVYDLFAVSNHYGGLGGGHYTAYCRMPDDEKWYTFDDSSVQEMSPSQVQSTAAYVLFYRRRGAVESDVRDIIAAAAASEGKGEDEGDKADGNPFAAGDTSSGGIGLANGLFGGYTGGGFIGGFFGRRPSATLDQVDEGEEGDGKLDEEPTQTDLVEGGALALAAHAVSFDEDEEELNMEGIA